MKQLTHTRWCFNGNEAATGKEVIVDYSPATGVEKFEVYAVRMGKDGNPDLRIDITEVEAQWNQFDVFVETWCDWKSKYAEEMPTPKRDRFFHEAAAIVRVHAESFRH